MLFSELPTSFPIYQKIEHQNKYRQNVAGRADLLGGYSPIDLISPFNALLPFEFYVTGNINPTAFGVYRESNDSLAQAINLNQLSSTFLPGVNRKYFYHSGAQQNINLAGDTYYLRFDFPGNVSFYSEVFRVCGFSVSQPNIPYLKLQWYNDNDLAPVFYNDKVNGIPRFTNVLYLDTYIHEYEPEIVEETEPDGFGKPIPTLTTANLRYRITVTVPAYLKKALVLTQMHDHVILTTAGTDSRTGELERLTTSTETLLNGSLSNLDIVFEENFLQKTSCGKNML